MDHGKRQRHVYVSNPSVHRLQPGTHGGQVSDSDEFLAGIGIAPCGGQVVVREIIVSDLLGESAGVAQLEQLGQCQAGQRFGGRVDGPDADIVPLSNDPSMADDEQTLTLPQALDVIPGVDKMVCIEANNVGDCRLLIRRRHGILRDERSPSPFRFGRGIVRSRNHGWRQEEPAKEQTSCRRPPHTSGELKQRAT